MPKSSNMISLTGGLGNQLFQLAFVLSQDNSRDVILERSIGQPRENISKEPEVFSFRLPAGVRLAEQKEISLFNRRVVNFALRMAISTNRRPKFFFLVPVLLSASAITSFQLRDPRIITSPTNIGFSEMRISKLPKLFVGYFQSFRWAQSVKTTLMTMRLNAESAELLRYINLAKAERPLVVHVRLGDYVGIETFGIPSLKYYENAINEQMEHNTFGKIWLFSNDLSEAMRYIPKELRGNTRTIGEIGNSSAETLELMRHGNAYVIGNSTFSWWGAFLSYAKNPYVIAPTPWFKGEPSPVDLIPPEWKQREAYLC